MGIRGKFLITVEAGYQLGFRQTMVDLLRPIISDPDYEDVRNNIQYVDRDTGIVSVKTILTATDEVEIDTSDCYQNPPSYDIADGQWCPGDYEDEPKPRYDAKGIIKDLQVVLKKMNPVGQILIRLDSVSTVDDDLKLGDKYVVYV